MKIKLKHAELKTQNEYSKLKRTYSYGDSAGFTPASLLMAPLRQPKSYANILLKNYKQKINVHTVIEKIKAAMLVPAFRKKYRGIIIGEYFFGETPAI